MVVSDFQVKQSLQKGGAKYVDSAKQDIMAALNNFKDLVPDVENFAFPDGKNKAKPTSALKGTIPVNYKGAVYNIPVGLYLLDTHPYYPPVCYVKPTKDMVIRESEHVNKEGRIFLPYLSEWRIPGYDLTGLLQVMVIVFQEKCPVFAASKRQSQPTPTTTAQSSNQRTPYPTASPAMPTPQMNSPYPNATPYPTSNAAAFPNPYMNMPAQPPIPPRPVPPPPMMGKLSDDDIRASIISALEDKIRLRLRENIGTKYAEINSIADSKRELQQGQQKIRKIVEELERANRDLTAFVNTYEDKKKELSKALSEAENGDGRDIDSAIDATTPLHRQLLLNYANDLSCDDVIYALGQAMIKRTISLPEYLKQVRAVARRQYEYRATMQKCRRVAGLSV